MKKQYKITEYDWCQYIIKLYEDGVIVKSTILDKLMYDDYIEEIEKDGYKLGYSKFRVEEIKRQYEYMLENIIEENE